MLGIEPRAVRITWSALFALAVPALLYQARQAILVLVFAVFLAYFLAPAVSLLDRFHQGRVSRTVTLTIVYVLMIGVLVGAIAAVAARASREAASLVSRTPELVQAASSLSAAPLPAWLEPFRGQIVDSLKEQLAGGVERFLPMLRSALGQVLGALGNLGFAVLVPILSFFLLKDAAYLRQQVLDVIGPGRHAFFDGLMDDMHAMLGQYIRALVLLSAATFLAYELYFQVTGVPYGSLLATIAAVLEFVPVVGPLTAGVVASVVALVSGYTHVPAMVVFFGVYRLFQDYVLQPFLMSSGIALHPLWIIFGALAGEEIGGVIGMVLSVPVMATLRIAWMRTARAAA